MKKIFVIMAAAAAVLPFASCSKLKIMSTDMAGTLSFAEFAISCDDAVETKADVAASGNYTISIYDTATGDLAVSTTYSAVKKKDNKISLPAGNYRLEASSSEAGIPVAAFEQPVYGATREFSITAGQTTSIGSLTCRLLQCKVTVSYSEDFIAMVSGSGAASVEVTAGYPLNYALTYADGSATFDQSAGYFSVNGSEGTTMIVTFKGNINGKSQKMTRTFTDVKARQWRQVKFIKKVNEEGNATFDIEINPLVDDEELSNDITGSDETVIGDDPSAPKGDGGISLTLDYEAGCDTEFTDLQNIVVPKESERTMHLNLKALVPGGVKKFYVEITSTSETFLAALDAANARTIDLIHPLADHDIIFQVVPFPHGEELLNQTEISFDLSAAQAAIISYPGTHNFTMNVVDNNGCRNSFDVVMIVNE